MKRLDQIRWSRGDFLRAALIVPAAAVVATAVGRTVSDQTTGAAAQDAAQDAVPEPAALPLTPACGDDDDDPTPAQTEGPYFTPNSPERTSLLEPDISGTRLVVSGLVLTDGCQPVGGALIDFWQADDAGVYDNSGYRMRGHQYTDESGRYQLETVVPGLYPGRTRHLHVKVQAPNGPVLTTQQYFPDEPRNARDGIYRPELLMDVRAAEDGIGLLARFDYVLATA